MKLNPFSKRQETVEVAAPATRHPWLGNVQDWDNEHYEAVQIDGADTRGTTRGWYLRHRATQTLVGHITPDGSK